MKVLLTATVQSHICQFHKPLVEVLHAHGCEVHVAARDNLAEKNGLKLDFAEKVFDVPFARSPKSPDNLKAYRQLKEIIREGHYDVIHCNTPMGGIVTRLAARQARKQGTKIIYTAHGFHFYQGAPKKNWLVFYPIEKLFSKLTDVLVTITREDYALASSRFWSHAVYVHGVGASDKFRPVPDAQRLDLRQELGFSLDQRLVLCTGELNTNKNQQTAILAMEQVIQEIPEAVLLLAGNGPTRSALEALVREHALQDHVVFLGYHTDLERYVMASDLVVSCSKREGMPLNIIEGMLCKKPVVASVNRGHRELIQDGVNGYLLEASDVDGFSARIIGLLRDDETARRFSEAGYTFVRPYTAQAVQKELEMIYQDCGVL